MSFSPESRSSMVFVIIKTESLSKSGIFVIRSLKIWGRLDLTGGVNTYVSMQAHGVRALKDSPNT